jgi:hypothetical protein
VMWAWRVDAVCNALGCHERFTGSQNRSDPRGMTAIARERAEAVGWRFTKAGNVCYCPAHAGRAASALQQAEKAKKGTSCPTS